MADDQRRPGMRAMLAHPGFRRPWMARTVDKWGDVFSFLALAIQIPPHVVTHGIDVNSLVRRSCLRSRTEWRRPVPRQRGAPGLSRRRLPARIR